MLETMLHLRAPAAGLVVFLVLGAFCHPSRGATDAYLQSLQRAREALARNDSASGLKNLDQALRIDPEGTEALVLLGRTYTQMGLYDEAAATLRRAVELIGDGPGALEARYGLASALVEGERNDEAVEVLARLLAEDPKYPGAHLHLGRVYLSLGRLESASAEFEREIAVGGGPGDASRLASASLGLGIAFYRLGDDSKALAALGKAPDLLDARYHTGLALARGGLQAEAAEALRDVLRRDPGHRGALQNLARCAAALGLEAERRDSLERLARLYEQEEEEKALRVEVRDRRTRAERLAKSGDHEGGVAALEQALAMAPDDVEVMVDLGWMLYRGGNPARAEEIFRQALELRPLRAEIHLALGRIRNDAGDLEGGLELLVRATELEPTSATLHTYLGQSYLRVKRSEDGVRELSLARRLEPGNPERAFNLGLALAQLGAVHEAARELEAAVAQGYDKPQVHGVLAQVYRLMGDTERSRKAQETFERLGGSAPR